MDASAAAVTMGARKSSLDRRARSVARAHGRARVALVIRARVDVNGSTRRRRRLARVRNRAPISMSFRRRVGDAARRVYAQRAVTRTRIVEWDARVETNRVCVK